MPLQYDVLKTPPTFPQILTEDVRLIVVYWLLEQRTNVLLKDVIPQT
jgi:hypothetical protein